MSALEILGVDHDGDRLWIARYGFDADISPAELAQKVKDVRRWGVAYRDHIALDEADLRHIITAWERHEDGHLQPLYPPLACRACGQDAHLFVDGAAHCAEDAAAVSDAENESVESERAS